MFVLKENIFLFFKFCAEGTNVYVHRLQLLLFTLLCIAYYFLMGANYRLLWDLATKEMLLSFTRQLCFPFCSILCFTSCSILWFASFQQFDEFWDSFHHHICIKGITSVSWSSFPICLKSVSITIDSVSVLVTYFFLGSQSNFYLAIKYLKESNMFLD